MARTGTRSSTSSPSANRITALSPRPRDPNLIDVRIDGERVGTVVRSAVDELKLREGLAVSAALRRRLMTACERAAARTLALRTLGRSDQSRATLARILTERHAISEASANATLDELTADGWQDDRRYATARAQTLAEERGCSHAFIAETLAEEGVDGALARQVARAAAPAAGDRARAEALARTALRAAPRGAAADRAKQTLQRARRIGQLLARRGFDADTIDHVLDRLGLAPTDDR